MVVFNASLTTARAGDDVYIGLGPIALTLTPLIEVVICFVIIWKVFQRFLPNNN